MLENGISEKGEWLLPDELKTTDIASLKDFIESMHLIVTCPPLVPHS